VTDRTRTYSWEDPSATASAATALAGRDFLEQIRTGQLPPPPMASTLGLELVEVGDGAATFRVTPAEWHYNPIGVVHGGLAATVLDSALGCAVHSTLPAGSGYTTVELKVTLVRAVRANTGPLLCSASVVHRGSRIATAEARLVDAEGVLYAHATTTCLVLEGTGAATRTGNGGGGAER
jgi:uncharacterized protein (TIGR00369 family)